MNMEAEDKAVTISNPGHKSFAKAVARDGCHLCDGSGISSKTVFFDGIKNRKGDICVLCERAYYADIGKKLSNGTWYKKAPAVSDESPKSSDDVTP